MAVADVVAELLHDFVPWFIPTIILNAAAILKPGTAKRILWEFLIVGVRNGSEKRVF